MMNPMMGHGSGLGALFVLHKIGSVVLLAGVVLFFAWAIKNWPATKLKHVAMRLMGAGLILILLSTLFAVFLMKSGRSDYMYKKMPPGGPDTGMMENSELP
jgi:predicted membrane channel-forming protein YqfA (hemolysin III family)